MKAYQTEQRKRLSAFLKAHPDRQFTIDEIAAAVPDISVSAIYRNINQMSAEGTVQRFSKEGSRKFLYQYFGHSDCAGSLHLKCDKCGKIMHMDPDALEAVARVVKTSVDFHMDAGKTVLMGFCAGCKK